MKHINVEFNLGTTISNECANLVKTLKIQSHKEKKY